MRLTTATLLLLAACGPSPALEAPPRAPSEREKPPPIEPVTHYEPEPLGFSVEIGSPGADPNLTDERHPRTCELRKARLEEIQRELAIVEREHEQYVRDRCKPTMKWQHDSLRKTSQSPERAWICDGKLVDTLKSPRLEYLLTRESNLRDYVRIHCDDTVRQ